MNSISENILPEGWTLKPLGDIAFLKSGSTPRRSNNSFWQQGTIPWLKSGELDDVIGIKEHSEFITEKALSDTSVKLFEKDTLLIAMYGATAGKLGILSIQASTNQAVCSIQNIYNAFNNHYIFYFLLSSRQEIIKDSFGGAQPNISKSYLEKIAIPLPPVLEQKRIVAKIDTVFAKIDKAISLTEESLKQAKNLLPSLLKEVFEKGKADGWEEKKLEEVSIYDKSKYKDLGKPYVGLEHIESHTSVYLGNKEPVNVKSSTFKFDTRHVLYGRLRPYLNKVLVPNFDGHCSTEIFPILPNEELLRQYLCYWLKSPLIVARIDGTWTGAQMPRANMNEVIKFVLPVPNKAIQKSMVDLLDKVSKQSNQTQSKLEEQLAYLKQLKSSILSKAFKGEL